MKVQATYCTHFVRRTDPVIEDPEIRIGQVRPASTATLQSARVTGNELLLDIEFQGGQGAHEFELYWDGRTYPGTPVEIRLNLHHKTDDNGRNTYYRTLHFNLTTLRTRLNASEVVLRINTHTLVKVDLSKPRHTDNCTIF